ncbi:hypothetical protein [Lapidilactobacillus luobeiensis]|uniref:hypothetical protein n=1 Tax=Lapidilactobacillus luobeiensis TaxID=2950371 RepID=UPI0021C28EF2|nr:hypothetical protein [Lapidilactobacillus luobeiensis]
MTKTVRFLQFVLFLLGALETLMLIDLVPTILRDWLSVIGWLPGLVWATILMYLAGGVGFVVLGLSIHLLQRLLKIQFIAPMIQQRLKTIQRLLWSINGLQLLCLPVWFPYVQAVRVPQVLVFNLIFFLGMFSLGVLALLLRQLSERQAAAIKNGVPQ